MTDEPKIPTSKRDPGKPAYCWDSGCPMAPLGKGRGFALGCGDTGSQVSFLFERPAEDELAFVLDTKTKPEGMSEATWSMVRDWREKEILRRKADYPDLESRFILRGAPVRGASGQELRQWAIPMAGGGLELENCFLENVLHCAAPVSAGEKDMYPTGPERLRAEACCARWNRLLGQGGRPADPQGPGPIFPVPGQRIDVPVVSLHPAGILKEKGGGITSLPIQADTIRKARTFAKLGKRVLILAGGRAAKWWLGYAESVTKWAGHYILETEESWKRRWNRIMDGMSIHLDGPKKRSKKSQAIGTGAADGAAVNSESKPRRKKKEALKAIDNAGLGAF